MSIHLGKPSSLFRITSLFHRDFFSISSVKCQLYSWQKRTYSMWSLKSNNNWKKAMSNAEKVVGYPTSFMSLRCLLSDELSNVALQMRKLVGTNHPLLKTARGLLYDSKHNLQTRGLIVLLIAKAAGPAKNSSTTDTMIAGISPSQRTLAEITEMIHTAKLIHKGVINLSHMKDIDKTERDELHFGNKIAILIGDFLLANACTALAELRNTKVVDMISISIKEMMESEFTDFLDVDGNPKLKETVTFSDWCQYTYLSFGSLLAHSCQAAAVLAGHNKHIQECAFEFGKNLAYAHQLNDDMKPFVDSTKGSAISITAATAPLVNLIEKQGSNVFPSLMTAFTSPAQKMKIFSLVNEDTLEECRKQCLEFEQNALKALDVFEPSDAKTALTNILFAVTK